MLKLQRLIRTYAAGACLSALSLALMSQSVIGAEQNTVMSYLDSVSSSYLYGKQDTRNQNDFSSYSGQMSDIEASFKLDSAPVITKSKTKVKLSLRDSDVKQVLRMLADKAGVNIMVDKSVEGEITLDLNDIDINDAFLVIFKTLQLTYTMENNTLTVMTLEAYKEMGYKRQNMTVIPIKYVNATNVAEFLNNNLFSSHILGLSDSPIVTTNPRTNQIVVFGSSADVMAIKRILPVIDTKPVINNFKVNHTTPKEMANLICDSLFYDSGETATSKGEEKTDLESEELVLGGGVLACRGKAEASEGGGETSLSPFKINPLSITYFPELGRISTVGGSPEQIQVISDFIKEYDKKQLMAYVELFVVELSETGTKTFENTWNLWTPFVSLSFDPVAGLSTTDSLADNPFFLWGNKVPTVQKQLDADGNVTTEQIYTARTNNKALLYKLKYLVKNEQGRVLTNPKFMVTNGKKTTLDMTSDYIKSVTSQVIQNDGINATTQKTYEIGNDNGFKIDIVPFISPDGYISMNITPEYATIIQQPMDGNGDIITTLLQRRDIELRNIRIKDGETLVLTGLISENESQTSVKMPFLADLPFIGSLFRGNGNVKKRSELVIVVTPHIVKDDESATNNVYDL